MIAKKLEMYGEDPEVLKSEIGEHMATFMKAAGYDLFDFQTKRRFLLFALAYAAGVMAKEWKVLDKGLFGNFKKPLLRAWQLSAGEIKVDVRERYLAYLREHAKRIVVVKSKKRLELTDDEFNKKKAFIIKSRDGEYAAAFPPHFMTSRFQGFESDFQKMRNDDMIIADKTGLQTKCRIRMKDGEVQHERVYMIRLDQWPLD